MRGCAIFAVAGLTAMFVLSPLSLSQLPSSSWPQLTVSKAEAYVTYRRARVATRRAYRRGAVSPGYYGHQDGLGGYPYSSGYYAYRGVYAPPVRRWGGWHRPHWGVVRGWHWWR